jgi:hypothetical protein
MSRLWLLSLGLLLLGAWPARAQTAPSKLEPIAKFVEAQTTVVVQVDLAQIDVGETARFAATFSFVPPTADEVRQASDKARGFVATAREYGVQDAYVIFGLGDLIEYPPPVVFTLKPGANEALIATHFRTVLPKHLLTGSLHGAMMVGTEPVLAKLRERQAVPRPDLAAALTNAGDAPIQIAAAMPTDAQRVVREMLAKLPPQIGGGEGQDLLDALQWTSVAIQTPPKLSVKWTIQSKDKASALSLRPRILAAINLLGKMTKLDEEMPNFAELAIQVTPQVNQDRLELSLEGETLDTVIKHVKAGPLGMVGDAQARMLSMNNLKLMSLAMHNYHDANGKFPPVANLSKDGKPLLSWRVHILPYVEQQALYQQFHLDEPWDSEHNLKLAKILPKVYVHPAHPRLAVDGKTVYVAPVGPKTIFSQKEGTKMSEITDGTSNTLMMVEVDPANAVIWTKPDDWQVNDKEPGKGLLDGGKKTFTAALVDGSVRVFPADIEKSDLRRLFQMNDGEPLSKQY